MSCAFGKIIFGWAWTSDIEEAIRSLSAEERDEFGIYDFDGECTTDDMEALGFEHFYSASDDEFWGYMGVELDDVRVYRVSKMSEFTLKPTDKQREIVLQKAKRLPESVRKVLGQPDVWVVWGDT